MLQIFLNIISLKLFKKTGVLVSSTWTLSCLFNFFDEIHKHTPIYKTKTEQFKLLKKNKNVKRKTKQFSHLILNCFGLLLMQYNFICNLIFVGKIYKA